MAESGTLDELRRRLDEVRSRHEADGRAAARAFWTSLSQDDTMAPFPGFRAGGVGVTGSRAERPALEDCSTVTAAPRRRGLRTGGASTRGALTPRGRGVWAHVAPCPELGFVPRELTWVDDQGDDDDDSRWADMEEPDRTPDLTTGLTPTPTPGLTPTRPPALTPGLTPIPRPGLTGGLGPDLDDHGRGFDADAITVKIDAATGRPLDRHAEEQVVAAAEQVAVLRGQHDVMLVNLVAELESRGVESPGGLSRIDWLRSLDPGLTAGQAKAFVTVGRALHDPRWVELSARVTLQHVTVGQAAQIIDFHERTSSVGDPHEVAAAVADLVTEASRLTPEELARLARHHTEQVRPPRDEDRLDAGREAARGLWFAQPNATGMVAMRATLDPEAAAILKSAVDPLSIPCPTKDAHGRTVDPDPRTPARRRADALLAVVQRGVASAENVPTTDKAKIIVTIDHEVLAGTVAGTGLTTSGDVLSPSTVRRLACDAAILPMVLGGASEPLDLGRERRLVTRGLRLALWQRDGGCSFPGCTIPASWCDAHHVTPWFLGGHTNLTNMALLCRRHHSHVHRQSLTATVTAHSVTWHE